MSVKLDYVQLFLRQYQCSVNKCHKYCFSVLQYHVSVHTGTRRGAGTDANVFLNIFGEQGDTGERPLTVSKTNKNKFERGNVSYQDCCRARYIHRKKSSLHGRSIHTILQLVFKKSDIYFSQLIDPSKLLSRL